MTFGTKWVNNRSILRSWMLLMGPLLLVGCGGGESGDANDTQAPTVMPTSTMPPESQSIELSDVIWTTSVDSESGEPDDAVETFPADAPAIIAAVEVRRLPAGSVITATWQIDGDDVPEAEMSVTADQDLERGWVSFQFVRDEDQYFPLGQLEVNVAASNGMAVTGEVTIGLP